NITPEMRPYEKEIDYLPGLVQPFDVYFLQKIPETVFIEQAEILQKLLTDDVIDNALHLCPKDIYELNDEDISNKIKARRNDLIEYAKGFKKVLDQKPLLTKSLQGSEDLKLPKELIECFGCKN